MDLVRAFAEDFEGIAELADVRVSGDGQAGQVELIVRSSSGAVTHPTVTFTQMNQRIRARSGEMTMTRESSRAVPAHCG